MSARKYRSDIIRNIWGCCDFGGVRLRVTHRVASPREPDPADPECRPVRRAGIHSHLLVLVAGRLPTSAEFNRTTRRVTLAQRNQVLRSIVDARKVGPVFQCGCEQQCSPTIPPNDILSQRAF